MNDKELLELAAKAARYRVHGWIGEKFFVCRTGDFAENYDPFEWNPLTDDGDALRLAVKLKIHIEWGDRDEVHTSVKGKGHLYDYQKLDEDPYIATRRAIVRAAAEIGRMK